MKRILPSLTIAALVFAACGSDDGDGSIKVDEAWARPTASGQTTGAVYFDVTAFDGDTLTGASVDPSVAADAQIHEVVPAETDSGDMDMSDDSGDMDMSDDSGDHGMDMGAMTMQELTDGLELPSAQTVAFEPGGYHVMLLDLAEPLEIDDEIVVTLEFATSDDMTITAEVSETAP